MTKLDIKTHFRMLYALTYLELFREDPTDVVGLFYNTRDVVVDRVLADNNEYSKYVTHGLHGQLNSIIAGRLAVLAVRGNKTICALLTKMFEEGFGDFEDEEVISFHKLLPSVISGSVPKSIPFFMIESFDKSLKSMMASINRKINPFNIDEESVIDLSEEQLEYIQEVFNNDPLLPALTEEDYRDVSRYFSILLQNHAYSRLHGKKCKRIKYESLMDIACRLVVFERFDSFSSSKVIEHDFKYKEFFTSDYEKEKKELETEVEKRDTQIQRLQEKLKVLQSEVKELRDTASTAKELREKVKTLKAIMTEMENNNSRVQKLEEQVNELTDERTSLYHEIEKLKELNGSDGQIEIVPLQDKIELIQDLNVVILGGSAGTHAQLRSKFPSWKYIPMDDYRTQDKDLSLTCDVFVVLAGCIKHQATYKFKDSDKVIYVYDTNVEKIIHHIYDFVDQC